MPPSCVKRLFKSVGARVLIDLDQRKDAHRPQRCLLVAPFGHRTGRDDVRSRGNRNLANALTSENPPGRTGSLVAQVRERTPMMKIILMIGAILMLWSSNATAQERVAVAGGKCRADLQKLCPGIPPGNDNLRNCMREHLREVSLPCAVALARFAAVRKSHPECGAHLRQQCKGVKREGGEFEACLKSAIDSLSDTCKDALGGAVPALAPK